MSTTLTCFDVRLGESQGRVRNPSGITPGAGSYVFVLGDDVEGYKNELAAGDYDQVVRDVDVTALHLVTFGQLVLRTPADALAASLAWEVSLLLNGTKKFSTRGYPGQTRLIDGAALNVSALTGNQEIGVRLEVVAA